jgi:phosphoribosylglycinamide formyltransferase-1
MMQLGALASGRGSNFQAIVENIQNGLLKNIDISLLISDQPQAPALQIAANYGIESLCVSPKDFSDRLAYDRYLAELFIKKGVHLIVLAGFMRIVGPALIERFPLRIMNIHPALLPSFPGLHAQKQALEHGVKITGCTVHFVDQGVDTGPIIIQAAAPVFDDDTEETLSARILKEEHRIYSLAIKLFAENRLVVSGRRVGIKNE